jgi:hypothetical protein
MRNPVKLKSVDLRTLGRTTQKSARLLLQEKFNRIAKRRRESRANFVKVNKAADAALRRVLAGDTEFVAAIKPLVAASRNELIKMERSDVKIERPLTHESAIRLLSGSGMRESGDSSDLISLPPIVIGFSMANDTKLDVRVPPYDDAWTDTSGGPHHQQEAWADKNNGNFGFLCTIGKEGGTLTCGAGVEALFMRNSPGHPPGQGPIGAAQVRTYTPYEYGWRNLSWLGPAHQHAGFGVLVWSVPIAGGPLRLEQDHERWAWWDGTSWYEHHNNANDPGRDSGVALQFGDEAPYFGIEPGRLYGAWIWCFIDADAHGADALSAGFAQAIIEAQAKLIVIGQQ